MERTFTLIAESGEASAIRGIRRPDWDEPDQPCPDCGATWVRQFRVRGGRYGRRNGAVVRRSDYWDAHRTLLWQCLDCEQVLYKHPAMDLLFATGAREAVALEF